MGTACTDSLQGYNIPFHPARLAESTILETLPIADLRLITCAIDEAARLQSRGIFASVPVSPNVHEGFGM